MQTKDFDEKNLTKCGSENNSALTQNAGSGSALKLLIAAMIK
jgi:hypothetical protein